MNGTRRWGLALSLVTALISGVSVYVNAFAVRAAGDPVVYTTAKNAVAAVLLVAAAAALGSRPSRSLPGAGEARPLPRGEYESRPGGPPLPPALALRHGVPARQVRSLGEVFREAASMVRGFGSAPAALWRSSSLLWPSDPTQHAG